ncbi:hypothetical protein N1851_005019 [Merluccius polli]|uniref:Integrase core domain-containing protein n=1 Tax=Merluccius polli TaxID=89951 RepID=A0AA47M733_MERPO|nr:hypothetical protein N1851_030104 [Merluccius polli]KAK0134845.1 hypothetical protein N1851_029439 [Merluccius polli]KAK0153286.1 hypothetical protein N1851_005019 [Merluccius polli]
MDDLIQCYFRIGFNNKEILGVLAQNHNIVISIRTLKRRCRKLGLFRRRSQTDINQVIAFVQEELRGNGQMQGYRWLHLRAVQRGLVVSQETVRQIIKALDPHGVEMRRAHRLRRRLYTTRGPNALWHMDSYDKLKPFGICINGCIDGYSRYVLWMEAYTTNNDPKVIASYYLQCVERVGGCPERLRADRGTENGHVEGMHNFLRREHGDAFAGEKSFLYGRSTANQRIESWWGILRKQSVQFWMNLFKSVQDAGHFSGDSLDKSLMQFCFLELVQKELDEVVRTWNSHRIRPVPSRGDSGGRPVLLYTAPQIFGGEDRLKLFDQEEIDLCKEECRPKGQLPCDEDVFDLSVLLMQEHGWDIPKDAFDAAELYTLLREEVRNNL